MSFHEPTRVHYVEKKLPYVSAQMLTKNQGFVSLGDGEILVRRAGNDEHDVASIWFKDGDLYRPLANYYYHADLMVFYRDTNTHKCAEEVPGGLEITLERAEMRLAA